MFWPPSRQSRKLPTTNGASIFTFLCTALRLLCLRIPPITCWEFWTCFRPIPRFARILKWKHTPGKSCRPSSRALRWWTNSLRNMNGPLPAWASGGWSRRQPPLAQAGKGPFIFRSELVHHLKALELGRQDFPGVCFHFKMRAKRGIGLKQVQNSQQVIGGILKQSSRRAVQRNVKMDAPFVVGSFLDCRLGGQNIPQVPVNNAAAIASPDHGLVQINIVGETGQSSTRFGGRLHP